MLGSICLFWIGLQLDAPKWYFTLVAIVAIVKIIGFGSSMYKLGADK